MEVCLILTLRCLNTVAGSAIDLTTYIVIRSGFCLCLKQGNLNSIWNQFNHWLWKDTSVLLLGDLKVYILQAALNNCISVHSVTAVLRTQEDHNKKDKGRRWKKGAYLLWVMILQCLTFWRFVELLFPDWSLLNLQGFVVSATSASSSKWHTVCRFFFVFACAAEMRRFTNVDLNLR